MFLTQFHAIGVNMQCIYCLRNLDKQMNSFAIVLKLIKALG